MQWVRLKRVYGSNYRSFYEPFEVALPDSGLLLVRGLNEDTGDSSAAGKSSFVLAISSLLGGCPYSGASTVSWGQKGSLVGVVIETPSGEYRIERCNGLSVYGEGGEWKGKLAEEKINQITGLDEWLRSGMTYRGQGSGAMFLGLSDAEKKEFLAKVLDLDSYETMSGAAKAAADVLASNIAILDDRRKVALQRCQLELPDINAIELELQTCSSVLGEIEEAIQTQTKAVRSLQDPDSVVACRESLAMELSALERAAEDESRKKDLELDVSVLDAEITKHSERLQKLRQADGANRQKKQAEMDSRKKQIQSMRLELSELRREASEKASLSSELDSLKGNICYTCHQKWLKASSKISDIELRIARAEKCAEDAVVKQSAIEEMEVVVANTPPHVEHPLIAQMESMIEGLRMEVRQKNLEQRDSQKQIAAQLAENRAAAEARARANIDAIMGPVRVARSTIESHIQDLVQLRVDASDKKTNAQVALARAIDVKKARDAAVAELASIDQKIEAEHKKFAIEADVCHVTGRSGFLGYIYADVLAEISETTNQILEKIANVSHLTVRLDNEKETKKGEVKRVITPKVVINGDEVSLDSGLSGGMRSAVGLAIDLAVAEVLARRRGIYPGWLVLDEAFDGLGKVAKATCLEMLSLYAKNRVILVIDHGSELQSAFSQVIDIRARNGRSFISK